MRWFVTKHGGRWKGRALRDSRPEVVHIEVGGGVRAEQLVHHPTGPEGVLLERVHLQHHEESQEAKKFKNKKEKGVVKKEEGGGQEGDREADRVGAKK